MTVGKNVNEEHVDPPMSEHKAGAKKDRKLLCYNLQDVLVFENNNMCSSCITSNSLNHL